MKISEIITDKYKLRIPHTVYYDLLADVREAEEEQKPCEDAVSRQAVLDLLVKYDNDMKFDVYSEIFDNIDKLPPVNPKQSWIPVSERLPEVGIDVLICDMERNIYLSHRSSFGSYFDDFGNKIKDIRAWMPLPEPYKAENEDKA